MRYKYTNWSYVVDYTVLVDNEVVRGFKPWYEIETNKKKRFFFWTIEQKTITNEAEAENEAKTLAIAVAVCHRLDGHSSRVVVNYRLKVEPNIIHCREIWRNEVPEMR